MLNFLVHHFLSSCIFSNTIQIILDLNLEVEPLKLLDLLSCWEFM